MLIQVLKNGLLTSDTDFSTQIEGTPQYCSGYKKATRDQNPRKVVVTTVLEEETKK
mgnify:CR=1 FL=1